MQRDFRKVIVLALSSVMAIGSSISISAEEPGQTNISGAGQMEGLIKPDVYQVVLPTDVDGIFDFVLDPQKLIEETNAAAYGGKTFEKGATVFFHRSDGQTAEEYSSSSDHVTIINRSTVPVDVEVDISISPDSLGSITMTEDRGFINDTNTSLYMALTDGERTVPVKMEGSSIHTTIPAAPEAAFEYSYDQERGEYSYGLKEDLNGISIPEYSFQLTGAVNEKGDWSTVGDVALLVNVTWNVTSAQGLDFGEENNVDQNADSESSPVLSEIQKTAPMENMKEEDTGGNSSPLLDRASAPSDKNHLDIKDVISDRDAVLENDVESDSESTIDRKKNSEGNLSSGENMELGEDRMPDLVKNSYTLKAGKPVSIDVDLGSGSSAATKVISVRWKGTDKELLGMENDMEAVRYKEEKLLLSEEWVNKCFADTVKLPAVLVVTFDDAGETEKEIVLNN